MVNGKQKGSAFERLVCKQLSLWVSEGSQEDVFWRSAMSGGRSTVAFAKGKRLAQQAGDISCIHPIGQPFIDNFMVECKSYRDLQYEGLVSGKGTLANFWQICKTEAWKYNKRPLLIAKQNQQPSIACVDYFGLKMLNFGELQFDLASPKQNFYAVLFDSFLKSAKRPGL